MVKRIIVCKRKTSVNMKKTLLRFIPGIIGMAMGAIAYQKTKKQQQKAREEKYHVPYGPYEAFLKRPLDIVISIIALILLSPIFIVLTISGAVNMCGNPFFVQERPGKDGVIFKLIKFRTMNNRKDKNGKLMPDSERLNLYGKYLRKTSLDEIPELINIVKGDMSIVGPRPLLVEYLPYYNEEEKHRHDVRPGLTGLSQVNGRNLLEWKKRFKLDVEYTKKVSFVNDLRIVIKTVNKVLDRSDILENTTIVEPNFADERKNGKV